MPTKTRLDPTAGGGSPPAEQDGAQGPGRGDPSASAGAHAPPAGDVAGFIDSLTALAAHLKERERLENDARRVWSFRALSSLILLVGQGVLDLFVFAFLASWSSGFSPFSPVVPLAIVFSGAGTALLAFFLYWRLSSKPLRLVPDSADRVALRHEDSPLRDRIRISQWILFDTAFTRFAVAERSFKARVASGVLGTAGWALLSLWVLLTGTLFVRPSYYYPPQPANPFEGVFMGSLALFLGLTLLTIVITWRGALADLGRAQHLGRQVLAFDADFGGFLPKVERERVEGVVTLRSGAPVTEADAKS